MGPAPLLPTAMTADGYHLVWADEFDNDGKLNTDNWTFESGFVRNSELQWYQPENAFSENGLLILEARREQISNSRYKEGSKHWKKSRPQSEYTSASITTRRRHEWQYGRFEIRARIDIRPGLWPAFWTLGSVGEWPSNGEIDIMESYQGSLLANVAWRSNKRWKPKWNAAKKPLRAFQDPDWSQTFHIWRMDWDEKSIKIYVDGELLNQTDLRHTINGDVEGRNPFHQKHYLLLSLAIGGDNGGEPSQTDFPAHLEIDYVRVYQKTSPL